MPRLLRHLLCFLCLWSGLSWSSGELKHVTLQLKWQHQFRFAGYYAALEKGYYRAAGLDVEIREAQPAQEVVPTVLSGKADFGVGTNDLLLSRYKGQPVVALAVIFQHSPSCILAARDRGIQSLADLVGRTVQYEPNFTELLAFFKRAGVDVTRLRLAPYSMDLSQFEQGKVDALAAYITNEPYGLIQRGFPFLEFRPISAGIDFYGDNLFTTDRMVRESPALVAAFRAASLKGWRYAMAHQEEIIDLILNKYQARRTHSHLEWEAGRINELMMPELVEIGYMSATRWRHIADTYAEVGLLPPDYDFSQMLYAPEGRPDMSHLYGWLMGTVALLLLMAGVIVFILENRRRLAESQARHRRTAETVPGVLFDFLIHPDGREEFVYFSPRCKELFELEPESLLGEPSKVWRLIHPDDLAGVKHARELARGSQGTFFIEARVILPSGRQRWLQFSARANPVQSGGVVLWSGFFLDSTDRHQDREARRESEDHFRALVSAMGEGVVLANAAGEIVDCNPSAERILGVPRARLIGNVPGAGGWTTFQEDGSPFPPDRYPIVLTLADGQSRRGTLMAIDNAEGQRRWISINTDPMRGVDGVATTGVVVTMTDVTELRGAEILLKASEERFRSLFEHSPVAYQSLDHEGRIIDLNEPLCRLLGARREDLIGKCVGEFWAPGQDFAATFGEFKASGSVKGELNLIRADGTPITVLIGGRVQRDASGGFIRTHCVLTDISERKRMEDALRESEARFRVMANAAPVLMWMAGEDGGCHWFNQSWLDFTGRGLELEAGEGWAAGLHEEDRGRTLRAYQEHFRKREPFRLEYRLRRHDGEYRWILDAGSPRFEENGRFVGYIGSCVDITENKASEALLRGILDASDEGVLVVGQDRRVLAVNHCFNEIWRFPHAFNGADDKSWLDFVADQLVDPERFLAQVQALYQDDEERVDELHLKDGRVLFRFTRTLAVAGVSARIWTFRDMTQLLASQKEIRDERARLRTLLETIPEPIWLKDPDGVYLACNPAFEKVYDLPEADLIGKSDHDLARPEHADFLRSKDKEALEAGRAIVSEEWVTYPATGEQILMAKIKTPMFDSDGRLVGVLGIGRDITEERRIQSDLSSAKEQAEAANRAKSQFLSRMSHELRTPLNAIIGFSELLRSDTDDPLTPLQQEFIGHIVNGGSHLLKLINEVLDLSRIETGRLEMKIETVHLPDLLEECLDMTKPLAASRGIHLEGISPASREVLADPLRLKQVLLNFLSNAVKYNREGGTVSVSCSAAPGERVHIAVSDTGAGIPEDRQAEVFQPFQRLGAERTAVEGTGIGLTICKRLIEAMNGRIGFKSRPNQGTTFWIELPGAMDEPD